MNEKINKITENIELSEMADFLPAHQINKISEITEQLKQLLPEVMSGWKDLFQAKFHLSEDVAGKIDGRKVEYSEEIEKDLGNDITLYDHTYGCPTKCSYCGYNTVSPPPGIKDLKRQLENKKKEMRLLFNAIGKKKISSLYFGGGTPTILPARVLSKMLSSYRSEYELVDDIEVTVEAHPSTLNKEKVQLMAESGVNRLSVGVQSLNKEVLKHCNRNYDEFRVLNVVSMATDKISTVNTDLIYGLQGQSIKDHLQALQKLTFLGVNQFTLYAAWMKEGSLLDTQFKRGEFEGYASPIRRAKMYLAGKYFLENRGYKETLGGWFSKDKDVEIYQKRWVEKEPCFGIGPGAYSYSKYWHYENNWNRNEYINRLESNKLPIKEFIKFGNKEQETTDLMWKIKAGRKFVVSDYQSRLLDKYLSKNLIVKEDGECKLSELGKVVREWIIGDIIGGQKTSEQGCGVTRP